MAAVACSNSCPTFRPAATNRCCRRYSMSPRRSGCRSLSRWLSPTRVTRCGRMPSAMVEKANAAGGDVTTQLLPRPIGLVIGLQLSANPFVFYPSYREIAQLPLAERVAQLRQPEVRARILYVTQAWDWIFPLGDNPNYEPDPRDQQPGGQLTRHRRKAPAPRRRGARPWRRRCALRHDLRRQLPNVLPGTLGT